MIIHIIFSIFIHYTTAQYDCTSFLDVPVRNITINKTSEDIIDSLYINDIQGAEVEDSTYVQVSVKNNYLTVRTNTQFREYNEEKNYSAVIIVKCADNKYRLEYNINVENNFCQGVQFNSLRYHYRYYPSILEGSEIDLGEHQISVRCVVGSVRFDIAENDYFILENERSLILKAIQDIRPILNNTFKLLAWDDFITKQNPTIAFVDIELVGEIAFTESTYYGYIDLHLNIIIYNGPIALSTDASMDYIGAEITEYRSFFDIKKLDNELLLTINNERKLPRDMDIITIMLTAYDVRYTLTRDMTFVRLNISLLKDNLGTDTTSVETDFSSSERTSEIAVFESDIPDMLTTEADISTIRTATTDETSGSTSETTMFVSSTSSASDIPEPTDDGDKTRPSNVHSPLRSFYFWVSNTKALSIIMVFICSVTILAAIIYLRLRMLQKNITS